MELPDDYFTEDDAILQMQADDDAYWANYRRMEEAKTVFVLEDVDAGETLRIEANDQAELALTVQDEDGAATIHLTPGQAALLRDWLARNVQVCAVCGGTGNVTVDSGATPWCTDFIMLDCPACNGNGMAAGE
jgi:hypothetical protein